MNRIIDSEAVYFLPQGTAAVILVLFVCICVVSQMLGVPVTLLSLLTSDMLAESLSEDFSILPSTLEPGAPSRSGFHLDFSPSLHLPIFPTAVFHPPQG
ncbi:MAG: hypothetical protein IPK92_13375 [Nitrospira sp.]|nr:hypothetical protein [Nitrospira sp.]